MPNSLLYALTFLLALFASFEVGLAHCPNTPNNGVARLRWSNARYPDTRNLDQLCRDFRGRLYEAAETRQAIVDCNTGVDRHKDIDLLDAEIEAINRLIATQCGT